jgi:heme/copper-type cytochrome/quinol oxidase subunit 4
MAAEELDKTGGGTTDVIVYICLLALAAIQFVIAYENITPGQMFVRMLIVAVIEAGLALLFFMHLWDNRGLRWFVLIFTIAVLLGLQYGWTDSYRLLDGVPWSQVH